MPRFKRYEYDRMGSRALERFNQDRPTIIAVDTETTGFAWEARAFCVTITWRDGSILYRYSWPPPAAGSSVIIQM